MTGIWQNKPPCLIIRALACFRFRSFFLFTYSTRIMWLWKIAKSHQILGGQPRGNTRDERKLGVFGDRKISWRTVVGGFVGISWSQANFIIANTFRNNLFNRWNSKNFEQLFFNGMFNKQTECVLSWDTYDLVKIYMLSKSN